MTDGSRNTHMTPEQVREYLNHREIERWKDRLDNQPHHPIEAVVSGPVKVSGGGTIYGGAGKHKEVAIVESDQVYRPAHYTGGGIETIDFIRAKLGDDQFMGYCVGNALKYLSRAGKKRDAKTQDLEKAKVYLGWAIEVSLGKEITK